MFQESINCFDKLDLIVCNHYLIPVCENFGRNCLASFVKKPVRCCSTNLQLFNNSHTRKTIFARKRWRMRFQFSVLVSGIQTEKVGRNTFFYTRKSFEVLLQKICFRFTHTLANTRVKSFILFFSQERGREKQFEV